MFNRVFQRLPPSSDLPATLARAERHLISETLLRASVNLLSNPEPSVAIEHMLESLAPVMPHMPLAFVWFGAAATEVIEPQVVVGAARAAVQPLCVERRELSQGNTRIFDISTLSRYALWRDLAQRFNIRSTLVAPIRSADDDRGLLCLFSVRSGYFKDADSVQFEGLGRWCYDVLAYTRQRQPLFAEDQRDRVTGLFSRRHAQRLLDDAWRSRPDQAHDNRGVLLLIDVDGLKKINDACGNRVGDLALHHLARAIEPILRRSDVISRWGDDEILAWLPAESAATAGATAERVRANVLAHPPDALAGQAVELRVSIGATAVPISDSLSNALDRLGEALAHAKRNGRNCVYVARAGL